jgi:hypothetical protein
MNQLILDLESCYQEIPSLRRLSVKNPTFKTWEARCKRILKRLFEAESDELRDFDKIQFWYMYGTRQYEKISKQEFDDNHFRNGIDEAELLLRDLISEAKYLSPKNEEEPGSTTNQKKVFISHSSKDKIVVAEIVQLLSIIGVPDKSIFCTSLEGYGITLGEDWLQTLKTEISGDVIVLFVISDNYYKSPVSLCEMGAAWALSKRHIPILIPPMDYNKMDGVIPLTQGFKIGEKHKWTQLKSQLESLFNLTPKVSEIWESRRDEILSRIENLLTP